MEKRHPILIVLHQATSSAGRVGQMLQARGYPLDIRRPPLGERLPDTLENHAGAVVFGGPMSANDPEDHVKHETDWMAVPLKEDKPFLGICLGAQMLVNHLGGSVQARNDEQVEIGWYPLKATEAGEQLMSWPSMIYHFHKEGFSLPNGAVHLAQSEAYPNQAFRYGNNAWAVQFHAELTQIMMQRWAVKGAHRFVLPGAQIGKEHLQGRLLYDAPVRAWLEEFLDIVFERGAQ
ncbi:MAG: glutamine amidotransferase [Pseudomonadota bacterium]